MTDRYRKITTRTTNDPTGSMSSGGSPMTSKTRKALGLAGVLALVVTSCGNGDSDSSSSPSGGDDNQPATTVAMGDCPEGSGGSIRMGTATQPTGLDPIQTTGAGTTGGNELAAIYDTLMQYNNEDGTYEPQVAESLEANETLDEWTLTLRDGVTFSNGDPLDAAAVIASIERYQGEDNKTPYRSLALYIESMEEVDDSTVRFTLVRPWASFPFLLANGGGMIVNTAVADEAGEKFGTDPTGAGAGPYEFDSFASGESITLKAKDDYWAGDLCIDELVFQAMPEDKTRWDAFRNDELDVAFFRTPKLIAEAKDAGYGSLQSLNSASNTLLLNAGVGEKTITADSRVRQAVGYAVDVDALDQRLNEGTGLPAKAIVADASIYGGDLEPLSYDVDKAKALVDEVRSEGEWDGSVELTCDRNREDQALALQAQLNAAGFETEVDLQPDLNGLIDKVIVRQDFEMSCWGLNILDSGIWPTINNSLYSTSVANYGGLDDEAMDAALDELSQASTVEEIKSALVPVQEAWNDSMPSVPLEAINDGTFFQEDVLGLRPNNNGVTYFDRVRLEK